MKSLALSLLVAAGLSLGAASASAETAAPVVNATMLAKMQTASRLAQQHEERARQYRTAARVESLAAQDCLRIAADNDKQGLTYYAVKMREKAAQHQKAALANQAAAEREDGIARQYRAQAQQHLAPKPAPRS